MTARAPAMSTVSTAPDAMIPALLTSTSTAPWRDSISCTADATESSSVTSSANTSTPRPSDFARSKSASAFFGLRMVAYTVSPLRGERQCGLQPDSGAAPGDDDNGHRNLVSRHRAVAEADGAP